jgi:hypothetical protein
MVAIQTANWVAQLWLMSVTVTTVFRMAEVTSYLGHEILPPSKRYSETSKKQTFLRKLIGKRWTP